MESFVEEVKCEPADEFGIENFDSVPWSCLEYEHQEHLRRCIFFVGTLSHEVGDVVTLNGTTGTLICNHGMGITALDIFSDILTDERDLHSFLEQQVDLEINLPTKLATTLTGLSIQAYLMFVRKTGGRVFEPIDNTAHSRSSDEESVTDWDEFPPSKKSRLDDDDDEYSLHVTNASDGKKKSSLSKFICNVCGRGCKDKKSLAKHMSRHTKTKEIQCPDCPMKFHTMKELRSHQTRHSTERPFKCELCGKTFKKEVYLNKHVSSVHMPKDPGPKERYQCDLCDKDFSTIFVLRNHVKTCHVNPELYQKKVPCDVCGKEIMADWIKQHMKTHDPGRPKEVCDICGKEFTSKYGLRTHREIHSTEKREKTCEVCGMEVIDLKGHMRTHTGRTHKCTYCGKAFTQLNFRLQHERQNHTGEKPYVCDICGKAYSGRNGLWQHKSRGKSCKPPPKDPTRAALNLEIPNVDKNLPMDSQ